MSSQCGDSYRSLIVTVSGYTPKNPYGSFALPYDYAEWLNLASNLGIRAGTHLERLQSAQKTEEQTIRSNELVDRYNTLVAQIDAMPSVFWGGISGQNITTGISQGVDASLEAACVMEQIDQELSKLGLTPPPEAGGGKSARKGNALNTAVLLGGLGLAGYLYFKFGK